MGQTNTKPKVIAIDFDGCLFEEAGWGLVGRPNLAAIEKAKEARARGDSIVLWTCREGEYLQQALEQCAKYGLFFDLVNENPAWLKTEYHNDPRKIGADEYWDNKAVVVKFGEPTVFHVHEHDAACMGAYPDCPCNTCAHDDRNCCAGHGKDCHGFVCPDYEKER